MNKVMFFFLWFVMSALHVSAQDSLKHLYLGNDTHTDLMWNGDEDDWYQYNLDMAKFYLRLGESTRNNPPESRSKWNYDVAWTLYMLEKRAPKELFHRLIAQIKNGQASVPYNFVLAVYGASTLESVLRSFYYGGYLQRTYDIPVELAVAQENATLPLGLASLWAGTGAKYSWKGVCNCATKINTVGDRNHEIYWYKGFDGNKVLMKWYSNYGWNAELGGYAEMLEPTVAVQQMKTLCESDRYPYRIAAAFGKGWDNIFNYSYDLVWGLGHRTLPGTKLYLSNQLDFFHHFESEYGDVLPQVTLSYGNEWDLNLASLAEVNGQLRTSMEKLRTAEAMAAIVTIDDPDAFENLAPLKREFYYALGVFNLHGWTADGPINRHDFATYMRRQHNSITRYVDALYERASSELGKKINAKNLDHVVLVYNALNWSRDAIVDIPIDGDFNLVRDVSSENLYPGKIIGAGERRVLRVKVRDIPPIGYKLLQLIKREGIQTKSVFTFSDQRLDTPFYTVRLEKSGAIRSLYDKRLHKEWSQGWLNYLGGDPHAGEEIQILHDGEEHITLFCRSADPLKHDCTITFYADTPRIDIQNRILENFSDLQHWTFDFKVDRPEVWHEEVGAVIKAKTASAGGHYADRMARYDYLTLNHFLNVGNAKHSITLSNSNCLFFRLGESKPEFLDMTSATVHILVGGQVNENLGVIGQDGDSTFHQNFSLMPFGQSFHAGLSMRFALEHQNPPAIAPVGAGGEWPEAQRSFFNTNNPDVLLWTLKPGEDGGLIARLWNMLDEPLTAVLASSTMLQSAAAVTHVETDIKTLALSQNSVPLELCQHQLVSLRLVLKKTK
ncbi:hypothetical protein JXA70_10555 [candidate division KSB1 bacterium]|nr:hypothetical protein [candidate division KSB1 bacterium]